MTASRTAPLRLIGGDLAVDFVNTLDPDVPGGDHIPDRAAFEEWCRAVGLPAHEVALTEVHRVRATIDDVLRPLATAGATDGAALAALRDLERDALARAALRPGGWEWTGATAVDRVVHAAVDLVLSDRHRLLRRCGNCTWLFLDLSRNHTRRWCSMETCGTEVKLRRLGQRRRSSP